MAKRPVFTPDLDGFPYVKVLDVEFKWYPGFAKSQLQKSVRSLHKAAKRLGISPILEISGKSILPVGVSLSAFNLKFQALSGKTMSVECAYQGSKVFEKGGPYHDLYGVSSKEAKTDERLQKSGKLIGFNYCGDDVPIEPKTVFYDCLYIMALWQNKRNLAPELRKFQGFSDIVFNPKRSFNCQARAAAIFVSLSKNQLLNEEAIQNIDGCLRLLTEHDAISPSPPEAHQLNLCFAKTDVLDAS
jgi:hypothetical protein